MPDDRPESDARLVAPAAARNREPILCVLREVLPASGLVLEIASGSGEHAVHFATALPGLRWQPSDREPDALASIEAYREAGGPPNLLPPVRLDAAEPDWPVARADAIVAINMTHISPWASTEGLFAGAARILSPGGALVLYEPFREGGRPLAPSNQDFDASLRSRDPAWGLREVDALGALAASAGLHLMARHEMPANNLVLAFRSALEPGRGP